MEAFATYLIKSSVWLTGFALVYALFLRNERFFTLNRIYLVSGILFSMIFPLFTWHYTVLLPVVPSVEIYEPQVQGIIVTEESFNPQNLWLLAYLAGILCLSYRILRQTLPVFSIIRNSETQLYSSAKLIRTEAYPASFSFFSFVFVNPSIDEIETNEIVNHELEHIRQQHWIDLLLFEILRTMQWFNPVIWLYGHFIRQNHEYLADERALQRSSNPAIYRAALLNQMFGGPVISLANSFNYSLNKKRFNMMKHTKYSPIRKLKLLLVLPFIAGVFYAFSAPEYKYIGGVENQSPQKPSYTITKDKIDIPFATQLQKSDLETVKTELAKLGMKIEYTSLAFSENGNLKQISASITMSDGGSVSFFSGELTTTHYPTFKTFPNGSFGVYSQKAVTGKVISEDGKPLKGASVVVSGKTIGTITDANGNFLLIMTDVSPISISYVGFSSQKVIPDFERVMVIVMKIETIGIDAMGNEATLTQKGNSGIQFNNWSEIPKYFAERKIQPLLIIDGFIADNQNIDKIDPETIEAIHVNIENTSTEKYGDKGKNGVIEITTKKDTSISENGTATKIEGNFVAPTSIGANSAISGLRFSAKNIKGNSKNGTDIIKGNDVSIDFGNTTKQVFIDGKEATKTEVDNLNPNFIESVSVLKDEFAVKKYGEKGKNGVIEITLKKASDVFTVVEEMPSFPGGVEALRTFVSSTMKYPVIALENGIQGKVIVGFIIGKNGAISSVKVIHGVDPSLDKEAMRIVKSMPNWIPGKQHGESVTVFPNQIPINFTLPSDYHPKSNEKLKTK